MTTAKKAAPRKKAAPKIAPVEADASLLERAVLDGGLVKMRRQHDVAEIIELLESLVELLRKDL